MMALDIAFKNRSRSTLSFEQELDLLISQVTELNPGEYGSLIDKILSLCEYDQVQYLWTVLEPFMHRDYLFSKSEVYQDGRISTLSTYISRELRCRLERTINKDRKKDSYRIPSSLIQKEEDVHSWMSQSVVPALQSKAAPRSRQFGRLPRIPTREKMHARSASWIDIPLNNQAKKRHLQDKEVSKLHRPVISAHLNWSSHDRTHYNLRQRERQAMKISVQEKQFGLERSQTAKIWQPLHVLSTRELQSRMATCLTTLTHLFGKKWDEYQRKRFLQVLVQVFQPSDLLYLYGLLMVRINRDFIGLLPQNLAFHILSMLSPAELCVAALVCRQWNKLSSSDYVWDKKCRGVYIGVPYDENLPLKRMFLLNRKLLYNRRKGIYKTQDLDSGLLRVTAMAASKDLIAVAGEKIVKVFNLLKEELISTLVGHQKGILAILFYNSFFLLSCSNDSTIKMWNYSTGICLRTFVGHDGGIWTMQIAGNILVSGSVDKTGKVWRLVKPRLLSTLSGHGGAVSMVDIDGSSNRVFTASTDKSIRIWDWVEDMCLATIPMGEGGSSLTFLSYCNNKLLCGSETEVSLWNVDPKRKLKMIKQLRGIKTNIAALLLHFFEKDSKYEAGVIVTGSSEGKLKYWSTESDACIASAKVHSSGITGIQVEDTKIISSSSDSVIKIWHFLDPV